ncbi:MAG: M16 family metallopeptidase, partial [Terriglobales bacterium]
AKPASTLQAPAPIERRIAIVDKPGAPQTALRIGHAGVARSSPDYLPVEVMNTNLGGLFSSRINMNLREKNGYTYGAFSTFQYRRGPGPFYVGTSVRTDVTAPAVREIFNELEAMRSKEISNEELVIARDSIARSLPGNFETTPFTAATVRNLFLYNLPLNYYNTLPAAIDGVTAADVLRAAKQYLAPEKMAVVAVGDRSKIGLELEKLALGPVEQRDLDGQPVQEAAKKD